MNSPLTVTAIFDIGKTNKKFLLFDRQQSVVYREEVTIDEIKDDDGDPCDDLGRLEEWIRKTFHKAATDRKYRIKGLNFSTYGASLVHLNDKGEVVTPLYNYLKPYPGELLQQFYDAYGGRERFSVETASPPLGMLNSGLQLYWLKHHKPGMFRKISRSLHFPQYLSYLFTGRLTSEMTSIGCHTAMWDFQKDRYHRWIHEEGMTGLLPDIEPVSTTQQIDYDGIPIVAGIGIHDSSASLAPYLLSAEDPFILLSTGTWSIAMNPFADRSLTREELEKDCLLYMNIFGKPVKASRLFLGSEYAHHIRKLGEYFGRNPDQMDCRPDPVLFRRLAAEKDPKRKLKLEKAYSSAFHPPDRKESWDLSVFDSYEEACHQLMLDLVAFQTESLQLAGNMEKTNSGDLDMNESEKNTASPKKTRTGIRKQHDTHGKRAVAGFGRIIITGGFSSNVFFTGLLAAFMPQTAIYTADSVNTTALGASLVINDTGRDPSFVQNLLGLERHRPLDNLNLEGYS